jgi:hypothetical protein
MEHESLVLDLLEWIAKVPRSYADTMSAWRTSCPRLTVWEDAMDSGFLAVRDRMVRVTAEGLEFLRARRTTVVG